jgi:hypothetical protein
LSHPLILEEQTHFLVAGRLRHGLLSLTQNVMPLSASHAWTSLSEFEPRQS